MPQDMGLICRTASAQAAPEMLIDEATELLLNWQQVIDQFNLKNESGVLFTESDLIKRALITAADKKIDLNEWIIRRLVLQQLSEHFGLHKPAKAKYASLGAVKSAAETLMSLIAYVEHKDDNLAAQAFDRGKKEIGATALNIIARQDFSLKALNQSLDKLMQLKPLMKPRILKACVAIILSDGKTTIKGIELVRTISTCLDCPMPPMQVRQ